MTAKPRKDKAPERRRTIDPTRRAYRIEDLPDDLAEQLLAGMDALRDSVPEEGDTIIG